jgi:hypothetical protein
VKITFERTFQALLNLDTNPCRVKAPFGYVWYTVDRNDRIRAFPVNAKGDRCYAALEPTLRAIETSEGETTLLDAISASMDLPVPEMDYQAIKDELAKTLQVPLWTRPDGGKSTIYVLERLDSLTNKWMVFSQRLYMGKVETQKELDVIKAEVQGCYRVVPYFREVLI